MPSSAPDRADPPPVQFMTVVLALLVMAACGNPAPEAVSGEAAVGTAQSAADFYRGKQIDLYIGYSPGGGYDTYARVLARHMGKHIPGNPTVVPQNMPGAGSLTLANHLYNIAPKDGTAIGTFGRGLAMEPLLGGNGTRFDATRFTWLGCRTLAIAFTLCAIIPPQPRTPRSLITGAARQHSTSQPPRAASRYRPDAPTHP